MKNKKLKITVSILIRFLFFGTIFTSAFLLFLIQPLIAKMILPKMGGTPSVWNTCIVFFNLILLLGYIYAYLSTKYLDFRKQLFFHFFVLFATCPFLPLVLPKILTMDVSASPIISLLIILLSTISVPFFVLSATGPLYQKWFALGPDLSANDPYFLYSISNAGSLLGLILYPLIIENFFPLITQKFIWKIGILIFTIFAILSILISKNFSYKAMAKTELHWKKISNIQKFRWISLSALPAAFMLALNTYITTDTGGIPLLWVLPLILYLMSFIIVFSKDSIKIHKATVTLLPFAILSLAVLALANIREISRFIPINLLSFFIICLFCHGLIAKERPSSKYLSLLVVLLGQSLLLFSPQ